MDDNDKRDGWTIVAQYAYYRTRIEGEASILVIAT
jgi:hypothetical protein